MRLELHAVALEVAAQRQLAGEGRILNAGNLAAPPATPAHRKRAPHRSRSLRRSECGRIPAPAWSADARNQSREEWRTAAEYCASSNPALTSSTSAIATSETTSAAARQLMSAGRGPRVLLQSALRIAARRMQRRQQRRPQSDQRRDRPRKKQHRPSSESRQAAASRPDSTRPASARPHWPAAMPSTPPTAAPAANSPSATAAAAAAVPLPAPLAWQIRRAAARRAPESDW